MKNLANKKEEVDINFKSNLKSVQSEINGLMGDIAKLEKMTDRLFNKGKNNNFTLTDRDATNLRGQAGSVQSRNNDLQDKLSNSIKQYNDIRVGNKSVSNQDISALEQTISSLTSALSRSYQTVGANSINGRLNPQGELGDMFRETLNMRTKATTNFSRPYSESASRDYDNFNAGIKEQLKDFRSTVSNLSHQYKRTDNRVDDTIRGGRVSYERFKQYHTTFRTGTDKIGQTNDDVNSYKSRLQQQLADKQSKYSSIEAKERKGQFSPNERDGINSQKNVLNSEITTLKASIDKLNEFNKALDKTQSTIDSSNSKLKQATTKDERTGRTPLSVDASKDSIAGILRARATAVVGAGISAAGGQMTSRLSSGKSVRLASQDNITPIMDAEANANGASKRMDNTILNRLQKAGNGAGYTGSQMSQFASTYTGTTGNTNYVTGANAAANLARYAGMGADTANGLVSSLGIAGGANTGITQTSNVIAGSIANSGMSAQSKLFGAGLKSIYDNISSQGLSVSSHQAQSIATVQGIMAKSGGSEMKGTEGARAYNQVANGIANGYNDPVIRALAGGNDPKYSGVEGSARFEEKLSNAPTDPEMLNTITRNLNNTGSSEERNAQLMHEKFGISFKQAKDYLRAQKQGKLTKSFVEKENKKNAKTGNKNGKKAYDLSGDKTLNQQDTYDEQTNTAGSEAGDGPRGAGNKIAGFTNPLVRFGGDILVGAGIGIGISGLKTTLGGMAKRGGISGLARGTIRGAGKFTRGTSSAIRGTYRTIRGLKTNGVKGTVKNLWEATKNSKAADKVSSGWSTAKDLFKGTEGASDAAKDVSEAAKGAESVSGAAKAAGDVSKLSKFGKFGKMAGLAVGAIDLGTGAVKGAAKGSGIIGKAARAGSSVISKGAEAVKGAAKGSGIIGKATKAGSRIISKGAEAVKGVKGGSKTLDLVKGATKVGGKFGSKIIPGVGIAASGISMADHINKHNWVGAAGDAVSATGDALSATGVGSVAGVPLSLAGAGVSAVSDWFSGGSKKSSKKSSKKRGSVKGEDSTISSLSKSAKGKHEKNKNSLVSLLKGFNDMLDKAEKVIADAKSINGGSSKKSSGSGGSVSGTTGKGNAAIKSVAEKVGKALGVDPSIIYAQLAQETGSGSITSGKNNYGGVVYTGAKGETRGSHQPDGSGYYANFNTLDDFANVYMSTLKKNGIKSGMSISQFAKTLSGKYYTGDEGTYERNMRSLSKNYKATGGIYSLNRNVKLHATGGIYDTPTTTDGTNVYGEAGAEAAIPVNSAHKFSGEAALKNLAGVFGKQVIDAGSKSNTSSNFHLNPSYQVNIKASDGMNEKELAQQVNLQLQSNQDDFMKKLNSFYAKAVAQ